jgi:hypothetical protein
MWAPATIDRLPSLSTQPRSSARGAPAAVAAAARQASDPVGEARRDRDPTYDQDEPRG